MAMYVHLTLESRAQRVLRVGINRLRKPHGDYPGGIYAMPVTKNYYASHQWIRELRRFRANTIVGVYFRIPDDERVWIGHYNKVHKWMLAVEAAATIMKSTDAMGWEVMIPRRIEPAEIQNVREVPQLIGWRFSPESKGKPPFCTCKFCTRGEYGSNKMRKRLGTTDD